MRRLKVVRTIQSPELVSILMEFRDQTGSEQLSFSLPIGGDKMEIARRLAQLAKSVISSVPPT